MKKNAFTLVEILIVVAILGLLMSIAVPSIIRAKQRHNYIKEHGYMPEDAPVPAPPAPPPPKWAPTVAASPTGGNISIVTIDGIQYIVAVSPTGHGICIIPKK